MTNVHLLPLLFSEKYKTDSVSVSEIDDINMLQNGLEVLSKGTIFQLPQGFVQELESRRLAELQAEQALKQQETIALQREKKN